MLYVRSLIHLGLCCSKRQFTWKQLSKFAIPSSNELWPSMFRNENLFWPYCLLDIYAIGAYNHWCCEFESRSGWGVQHYVIKFVSDLQQIGGFLRFPAPIKLTATILLKVVLNSIKPILLIDIYLCKCEKTELIRHVSSLVFPILLSDTTTKHFSIHLNPIPSTYTY